MTDAEIIQTVCLGALRVWESGPRGPFSWPLDSISDKYGYLIHSAIVGAWNEEGRVTR